MNTMRQIRIEKVTLNIGVGTSGDNLEKATKLLENISKRKPVQTKTMKRIPSWGLRPKLPIGCKVTLRGKESEELLNRLFDAVERTLKPSNFDQNGNFSFGIKEYIDIPSVDYDPEIGIIGLEVSITLERQGFRVKRRRLRKTKIPNRHLIKKQEAIDFISQKFGIKIQNDI